MSNKKSKEVNTEIKNNTVTAVHLQPNPADAGNGSGALMIDVP